MLLDTTATNVLDLYAFQERAAQKGDAAAEAAGSFMLFLNSDCIVDFRYVVHQPCAHIALAISSSAHASSAAAALHSAPALLLVAVCFGCLHLCSLNSFTQLITLL